MIWRDNAEKKVQDCPEIPPPAQRPATASRKAARASLPWSWAEQRLKKSHNYWISTVKPDGSPHTMVVWGLWQDGAFSSAPARKSLRHEPRSNPNCIVCTENASEAVIVEGVAEIADLAARKYFLAPTKQVQV